MRWRSSPEAGRAEPCRNLDFILRPRAIPTRLGLQTGKTTLTAGGKGLGRGRGSSCEYN